MPHQDRLNIAVFIDFDNIEIGVKTTLNQQFDVGTILDAIKERGEVVTKIAYADWTRAGEYSRTLTQHAIRLVQRNLTPGGDKNGADINLALDALEMAFTHPHINAYVIVGGDSDFLSLVEKLKQYDKKVFVVGGRAFTSVILQRNCHEFIAYENLQGVRKTAARSGRPMPAAAASAPIAQAFPIVRRALKILADREVSPQTGLLKSTLLQLDSTFSERNYGASSFLDFAEKLAQAGLVQLKHAGRSVMVELNDGFEDGDSAKADLKVRTTTDEDSASVTDVVQAFRPAEGKPGQDQRPPVEPTGSPAEGVRVVGQILRNATGARWPMYLRNVKQILRAADAGFDERRYGFGGLMDLLRACQKEGLIRLERDRRGGLRVFQGAALQRAPAPAAIVDVAPTDVVEIQPGDAVDGDERAAAEPSAVEPIPIDTTAELLGRAKPRRPRSRVALAAPRPSRKAAPRPAGAEAPRKPAARRAARSKKPAAAEAHDEPEQQ
ncbi:MAG: hypothetical protein DMF91_02520 [Acidobacteria bacterium]|nr:MAG: hypothetical protein DMF91_02520 [Acidobacteriota bacterium]